ncbi:MAG: hypothetical protein EOO88_60610 [Pedobacter sp.]|nr:MAG: hypothetical protein EOO88_60610 [Pedobacter sp.]
MKTVELSMEWRLLIAFVSVIVGIFPLLPEKPNYTPRTTVPLAITNKKVVVGSSDICTTAPRAGSTRFECRSSSWYSEKAGSKTRLDLAAYSQSGGKGEKQGMMLRIVVLPDNKSCSYWTMFPQYYWVPMKYIMIDARKSLRSWENGDTSTVQKTVEHTLTSNLTLQISKNASKYTYPGDGMPISLNFEQQTLINLNAESYVFNSVNEYCDFVDKFTVYSEWLDKKQPSHQTAL